MANFSLKDKVAVITGAGRGIGAATARLFSHEGAKVVLASRTQAEVESVAEEINGYFESGPALAVPTDITSEESVQNLFAKTLATFGPVDILVNCAGAIEVKDFVEMDLATWEGVMAVNVRGTFLCSREAFRQMIEAAHGGAIVNITSLSGVRGPEKFRGFSAYVVSKYGVLGLSEILAVEGRAYGIRVNSVAPGAVDTVMLQKAAPFLKTKTTGDDIAKTILYLADDKQSRHITGANIEVFSNE